MKTKNIFYTLLIFSFVGIFFIILLLIVVSPDIFVFRTENKKTDAKEPIKKGIKVWAYTDFDFINLKPINYVHTEKNKRLFFLSKKEDTLIAYSPKNISATADSEIRPVREKIFIKKNDYYQYVNKSFHHQSKLEIEIISKKGFLYFRYYVPNYALNDSTIYLKKIIKNDTNGNEWQIDFDFDKKNQSKNIKFLPNMITPDLDVEQIFQQFNDVTKSKTIIYVKDGIKYAESHFIDKKEVLNHKKPFSEIIIE